MKWQIYVCNNNQQQRGREEKRAQSYHADTAQLPPFHISRSRDHVGTQRHMTGFTPAGFPNVAMMEKTYRFQQL